MAPPKNAAVESNESNESPEPISFSGLNSRVQRLSSSVETALREARRTGAAKDIVDALASCQRSLASVGAQLSKCHVMSIGAA